MVEANETTCCTKISLFVYKKRKRLLKDTGQLRIRERENEREMKEYESEKINLNEYYEGMQRKTRGKSPDFR